VALTWWTLFVAMTSFSIGVWIRTKLIRASLMNELASVEIARLKATEMIEKTRAVEIDR
jgi:hypothetical protein